MDKSANKKLEQIRHSCAHLLAASVKKLWPNAKNAIGPAIESGFYQDFDMGDVKLSENDFEKIEKKMLELLKTWDKFEIKEVTIEQARKDFADNPYKLELIEEFAKHGIIITETEQGDFLDLCKGGHSNSPQKEIKHFKLLSTAGAYWKENEKNKMLTRIYGTCFLTQRELDDYLNMLEESKKRDHKKLGPKFELFFFHETSPGMPYWLPKGVIIYNELINFWRKEHLKRNYQETISPILNKKELYVTSGHFDHYWQDMFVANMGKDDVYGIKAMNCPNAMLVYNFKTRSYRDLPLRLSDTDPIHRYELSGVLNGLLRAREFRQDDAHIFVSEDQLNAEFKRLFEIVERFYSIFKLDYSYRLGKRPEKFMGDPKVWNHAEEALEKILKESKKSYTVVEKEGAFYGPKIDILMKDSLGRSWQMGTLQLDFQQPLKFDLKYADADGNTKTPIVIHRVIYGSLERFIGILIEHFAMAFPTWLSPLQVMILPIADRHNAYAETVVNKLKEENIRVEMDGRSERLQAKIRDASLQKVPYLGIIGDREIESANISVRTRDGKDLDSLKISDFLHKLKEEIDKKI